MGLRLTTLKSKKYSGMVDMAKQRKRFPSSKARFCTQELKIIPFIDFVLDKVKDDFMVIEGIRAEESTLRSRMKQDCQYFKYYFEPYKSNEITIELLGGRDNLSYVQKVELEKAHKRLALGFNDEKYYTYRKNDIVEYVNQFAAEIYRPHFHDTAMDVFAYIYENGQSPNPLYFKGSKRVGCYPCINSSLDEIREIGKDKKYRKRLIDAEKETGSTFFPPGKIPRKYAKGFDPKTGKKINTAEDVFLYVEFISNTTLELFPKEETRRCMSHYAICE